MGFVRTHYYKDVVFFHHSNEGLNFEQSSVVEFC